MKFIGIDPGFSGGIVIIDDGDVLSFKCPKIVNGILKKKLKKDQKTKKKKKNKRKKINKVETSMLMSNILALNCSSTDFVVIENVHSMPSQGVVSTFTFGMNYGIWLGILASLNIKYIIVEPVKWMDHFGGDRPRDKKDRKNFLQDIAQKLYPLEKVPKWKADALLLAIYAKNVFNM